MINDEFRENIAKLEAALRIAKANMFQELDIGKETSVPKAVEEPTSNAPVSHRDGQA